MPELRVHPMHLVDAEDLALIRLWELHSGGMAPGPLPFAGGTAEQPASVLEAFRVISSAWEKLMPKREGEDGEG